jgi:CheY-like chemotaxis protein
MAQDADAGDASDVWLRVRVIDNGTGTGVEEPAELFEAYRQGLNGDADDAGRDAGDGGAALRDEDRRRGRGLGLAIVANIVHASGGAVALYDRTDGVRGAVFDVVIPAGRPTTTAEGVDVDVGVGPNDRHSSSRCADSVALSLPDVSLGSAAGEDRASSPAHMTPPFVVVGGLTGVVANALTPHAIHLHPATAANVIMPPGLPPDRSRPYQLGGIQLVHSRPAPGLTSSPITEAGAGKLARASSVTRGTERAPLDDMHRRSFEETARRSSDSTGQRPIPPNSARARADETATDALGERVVGAEHNEGMETEDDGEAAPPAPESGPRRAHRRSRRQRVPQPENVMIFRGGTVLVVDDEALNVDIVARLVRRMGASEVVCFSSGEGMLAWFNDAEIRRRRLRDPVAIFIDFHLGSGMSGLDATTQLRRRGFRNAIVVTTGGVSFLETERCHEAGVTAIVLKPFSHHDVLAAIQGRMQASK